MQFVGNTKLTNPFLPCFLTALVRNFFELESIKNFVTQKGFVALYRHFHELPVTGPYEKGYYLPLAGNVTAACSLPWLRATLPTTIAACGTRLNENNSILIFQRQNNYAS